MGSRHALGHTPFSFTVSALEALALFIIYCQCKILSPIDNPPIAVDIKVI